jgi:hypothetical protein
MEKDLTRRAFLQKSALLGIAVGAGSLLSGCSSAEDQPAVVDQPAAGPLDCSDVTGLSDQQVTTRTGLQYVDVSEKPDQNCLNCLHWVPADQPDACGGCNLVPGPIAPEGWCLSWAAQS